MVPNRAKYQFELKKFWLADNNTIEAFASLRFVNGAPKVNFQKHCLLSERLADVSRIRQVTTWKVCFPDFLIAYTAKFWI